MLQPQHTLSEIATEILAMYQQLDRSRNIIDICKINNLLGRRLKLLLNLKEGAITTEMTQEQARTFHEILLDSIALQLATGHRQSVFDSFHIDDPTLLGNSRYRRAKLQESDQFQLDWYFQIFIQASASTKGFGPLNDLREDTRFRNSRVCDFAIKKNGTTELLECKRIHPESSSRDSLDHAIKKIKIILPSAIDQLNQTSFFFKETSCAKHALIDISGYTGNRKEYTTHSVNLITDGFQNDDIDSIERAITPLCKKLDQLTLCWHTPIWINGKIHAILQQTKRILCPPNNFNQFNYEGWTVEGYPRSQDEYCEFRISSSIKSLDSIAISYKNLSDPKNFWTTGPAEACNSKGNWIAPS